MRSLGAALQQPREPHIMHIAAMVHDEASLQEAALRTGDQQPCRERSSSSSSATDPGSAGPQRNRRERRGGPGPECMGSRSGWACMLGSPAKSGATHVSTLETHLMSLSLV